MKPTGRIIRLGTVVLASAACLLPVGVASAKQPNIILILTDDTSWTDLPFYNPPVVWEDENRPLATSNNTPSLPADRDNAFENQREPNEFQRRWPDLNRFSARVMASRESRSLGRLRSTAVCDGGASNGQPCDTDDDCGGSPCFELPRVVPVDLDEAFNTAERKSSTFRYEEPGFCDEPANCPEPNCHSIPPSMPSGQIPGHFAGCAPTDVLQGFGGLNRLATEGVTFPRFYASSSRCTPTRGAILTGRSTDRTNVRQNGNELTPGIDYTIANYLASRPPPDNYTTGLVGKWHLGENPPSHFGFQEYIIFSGATRKYFSPQDLDCSVCTDAASSNCSTDSCVSSDGCSDLGLYIGPDPNHAPYCDGEVDVDSNPYCCKPGRSLRPGKRHPRGTYRFRDKQWDPDDQSTKAWKKESSSELACTDDRDVFVSGCHYMTRWERDMARNFISRHMEDPNPFFLMVSMHASHSAAQAPERTRAHYEQQRPARPGDSQDYWAVMEEMDAAVGGILDALDGMCGRDSWPGFVGEPCKVADGTTENPACGLPGGPLGSCVSVANDTLVVFTQDHGRTGRNQYGDPQARGGKESLYEGGVKVGLLARWPQRLAGGRVVADRRIGSAVDLFATFAEVAGATNVNADNGRLDPQPATGWTDGQSLLPILEGTPADGDENVRDYAFAQYAHQRAVVTRPGYFNELPPPAPGAGYALKMCGVEKTLPFGLKCSSNSECREGKICNIGGRCVPVVADDLPCNEDADCPAAFQCDANNDCRRIDCTTNTDCTPGTACSTGQCTPLARTHRAGTCYWQCDDDDQCRDPWKSCEDSSECRDSTTNADTGICLAVGCVPKCTLTKGVCLQRNDQALLDACKEMPNQLAFDECNYEAKARCFDDNDCLPVTESCETFDVPCELCRETSWKLRMEDNLQDVRELYDLTSNVEESDDLNCIDPQRDPGASCSGATAANQNPDVCEVQRELSTAVCKWAECGKDDHNSPNSLDCENYRTLSQFDCP